MKNKNTRYDILFVRHGETEYNVRFAFQGLSEEPLNEKGRQQAAATGKYLKANKYTFDVALTSPLKRTRETADILEQYIPIKIQNEPLLRERAYGIFEGKTPTELKALYPEVYSEYEKNKPFLKVPNGETCLDVEDRIKELFWLKIPKDHLGKARILAVTHINPVRAMLHLLKLADWDVYYQLFKNASITRIETDLTTAKTLLLNFSCFEDTTCNLEEKL